MEVACRINNLRQSFLEYRRYSIVELKTGPLTTTYCGLCPKQKAARRSLSPCGRNVSLAYPATYIVRKWLRGVKGFVASSELRIAACGHHRTWWQSEPWAAARNLRSAVIGNKRAKAPAWISAASVRKYAQSNCPRASGIFFCLLTPRQPARLVRRVTSPS
jgi:hypothetical protein